MGVSKLSEIVALGFEELITEGENIIPTRHEKIMVLKGIECNLNLLNGEINELAQLANRQVGDEIKLKLKEILPEYQPYQSMRVN